LQFFNKQLQISNSQKMNVKNFNSVHKSPQMETVLASDIFGRKYPDKKQFFIQPKI